MKMVLLKRRYNPRLTSDQEMKIYFREGLCCGALIVAIVNLIFAHIRGWL